MGTFPTLPELQDDALGQGGIIGVSVLGLDPRSPWIISNLGYSWDNPVPSSVPPWQRCCCFPPVQSLECSSNPGLCLSCSSRGTQEVKNKTPPCPERRQCLCRKEQPCQELI